MDLTKYNVTAAADNGADLELVDPITGDALEGVTIRLLGTDSAAYRNYARDMQRKRMEKLAKSRNRKPDFSVSEQEEAEMLAICTVGWAGLEEDGEELKFSHDAAVKLYMDYPWIKEQVDSFVGDRANFLAKP